MKHPGFNLDGSNVLQLSEVSNQTAIASVAGMFNKYCGIQGVLVADGWIH